MPSFRIITGYGISSLTRSVKASILVLGEIKMKHSKDPMVEYYEGLFEHRHKVQEIYDQPLMGWKSFIAFLVFYGIVFYLGTHGYLGD